uniref:Uncharacterized protein n=1 Tax=Chlamydomonas euryale TaxID=1486919 RepID=A0A7R9VR66_9CHLO
MLGNPQIPNRHGRIGRPTSRPYSHDGTVKRAMTGSMRQACSVRHGLLGRERWRACGDATCGMHVSYLHTPWNKTCGMHVSYLHTPWNKKREAATERLKEALLFVLLKLD